MQKKILIVRLSVRMHRNISRKLCPHNCHCDEWNNARVFVLSLFHDPMWPSRPCTGWSFCACACPDPHAHSLRVFFRFALSSAIPRKWRVPLFMNHSFTISFSYWFDLSSLLGKKIYQNGNPNLVLHRRREFIFTCLCIIIATLGYNLRQNGKTIKIWLSQYILFRAHIP